MSENNFSADRDHGVARWSVVHTQPHRETRAHAHLQNQGFRSFLPLLRKTIRHARQFHTRLAPLFPRYLFVEIMIGRDRWTSIRGTFGVSHLLMDGDQPRVAPVGVVETLLDMADPSGLVTLDPSLRPGQPVRIGTGPFAGLVGKLAALDDSGRVKVLLDILGKAVLVSATRVSLVPAA
jgi:transcriptional antiterminator RfaH